LNGTIDFRDVFRAFSPEKIRMYIGKTLFAQIAPTHRAVSRNGFCENDLARKPSRHRSLFVCTII